MAELLLQPIPSVEELTRLAKPQSRAWWGLRGGHTAQQSRHLRACLGEAEDVVDEEQHVLILDIAEVLRHGQAGQSHEIGRAHV